jgi:hypothetical protein
MVYLQVRCLSKVMQFLLTGFSRLIGAFRSKDSTQARIHFKYIKAISKRKRMPMPAELNPDDLKINPPLHCFVLFYFNSITLSSMFVTVSEVTVVVKMLYTTQPVP